MKKNRLWKLILEHTIVQFGTALIFYCIILAAAAFMSHSMNTDQSFMLSGSGQAVINSDITNYLNDKGKKSNYHTAIFEFPENCKLLRTKEYYQLRSLKDKTVRQKINPDYPIFMGEGAYLYLYHTNFIFLMEDFSQIQADSGVYLNNGGIFNQNWKSADKSKVLLLKLPNGLYMNSCKLMLKYGTATDTISVNSILQFKENSVLCCSVAKGSLETKKIDIDDTMAVICLGKKEMSYSLFYDRLKTDVKAAEKEQKDTYSCTEGLYQYFLGNKYDYNGTKTFYRSKDGYFMDYLDSRSMLDSAPLYYKKGKKLLLPTDYVLIQPKLFLMNKMPAMSELTYKKGYVYAKSGDKLSTLSDSILFDGQDTYLFFNSIQISWKEEQLTLSPLSSITVGTDGSIGLYNYKKRIYENYQANGYQDIIAVMKDGTKINLSQDILYRPDGQEQILFSEPSLLNEFE